MRVLTARWVADCIAAASVVFITGALLLVYTDRHLGPAGLSGWDLSDVFGGVANLAVPVVGFVLASRRPANRVGWLFLVAGLALELARICLQAQDQALRFTVSDDSTGYDARRYPMGRACGTWPTGWRRSAVGLRSCPLRARAPLSAGTCPSLRLAAVIEQTGTA